MNPWPLVWALLRRNGFTSLLFVGIIAVTVALGVAISAQERALRLGSARAADKFDLIVAAPGSATDLLFSVVYLNPTAVELLDPAVAASLLVEPKATFAAPIGFGDNIEGDPVVGTTADFVVYLSSGLAEGRPFAATNEAVIGALSPHAIGETLEVSHGNGMDADADAAADAIETDEHDHEHEHGDHHDIAIVGRMQPTGTPWDRATVVPIEYNWTAHGLDTGHAPDSAQIGPPFDPTHLPGIPAIVVKPVDVAAAYGLRGQYRTERSTAFFPAEILVQLYGVLGDVGRIMSALTLAAQLLVVVAILAGIVAILDLQRQRFAVLRALGAAPAFVFVTVWAYVGTLIASGAVLGLALGWLVASAVSTAIASQTGVAMHASIGPQELALLAAFAALGMILALVPCFLIYRRPVADGLR